MNTFSIDAGTDMNSTVAQFESTAIDAERRGYDGVVAPETKHDAFVSVALAARATERIQLSTGIAVAFARNPMATAMSANDIQQLSGGRFTLGLGSQVKAHIEKRFSMPWSNPTRRMEEYVAAVRAIWASWQTGDRLAFRGEFYQHTLMTPFFDPGPSGFDAPPIWLAAVGEGMAEVAGRVADGIICHSFTTAKYLAEVTRPAMLRGQLAAGRSDRELDLALPAFVTIGEDAKQLDAASRGTRAQIAFYGSTPAYRAVLELHGWEEAADTLHSMSLRGRWDEMGAVVTDEMLHAFSAVGSVEEVASILRDRFAGIASRLSFYTPYAIEPAVLDELASLLKG
jgi:probable F420-dependent oxidoreductase